MALVVLTGAARSGKSAQATALASVLQRRGERISVAVFGRAHDDAEFAERIARHRDERPDGFETLEVDQPLQWAPGDDEGETLLIECMGTLTAAVMSDLWDDPAVPHDPVLYEEYVSNEVSRLVEIIVRREANTIVVTNEAGWGVVPAHVSGRVFRDVLGRVNRRLVEQADAAYLCIAGRLLDLSTLPRGAAWPED